MSKSVDYYNLLGISIFASEEEIRAGYLKKITEYHPDTYKGSKKEAENITAEINVAYATRKDKDKKYVYDTKFGFDKRRDEYLKQQARQQQKAKKQEQKQNKKHKNINTADYAQEKVKQQKAQEEAQKSADNAPKNEKVKTNFFTKKPKRDVKSATIKKVVTPEQSQNNKERIILDCVIIILIVIVILLIIFK